jgi:hypothetical protein
MSRRCTTPPHRVNGQMRQLLKKSDLLRRGYYRLQLLRAAGQFGIGKLVAELASNGPRTFVEFGFDPTEFNCIRLAREAAWSGLLIDGAARKVDDAQRLFHKAIAAKQAFLTLDNLDLVRNAFASSLGVLSIDVDGNDYWFLKALIDLKPRLICIEYNSSLGLDPITVPYDPEFDRQTKHPRGWYHGASLMALAKLCAASGYGLAAVPDGGGNALFTKDGKLDPGKSWKPNELRERLSGIPHREHWDSLKNMPFVTV